MIVGFTLLTLSENFRDSRLEAFGARAARRELRVETLKVTNPKCFNCQPRSLRLQEAVEYGVTR